MFNVQSPSHFILTIKQSNDECTLNEFHFHINRLKYQGNVTQKCPLSFIIFNAPFRNVLQLF